MNDLNDIFETEEEFVPRQNKPKKEKKEKSNSLFGKNKNNKPKPPKQSKKQRQQQIQKEIQELNNIPNIPTDDTPRPRQVSVDDFFPQANNLLPPEQPTSQPEPTLNKNQLPPQQKSSSSLDSIFNNMDDNTSQPKRKKEKPVKQQKPPKQPKQSKQQTSQPSQNRNEYEEYQHAVASSKQNTPTAGQLITPIFRIADLMLSNLPDFSQPYSPETYCTYPDMLKTVSPTRPQTQQSNIEEPITEQTVSDIELVPLDASKSLDILNDLQELEGITGNTTNLSKQTENNQFEFMQHTTQNESDITDLVDVPEVTLTNEPDEQTTDEFFNLLEGVNETDKTEEQQEPDFTNNLLMQEDNIIITDLEPTTTSNDTDITFDMSYIQQYVDEN